MMDAKLKADWVKALRSGKYKQAEGKLHDPDEDSYCCLGVLCKVVGAKFGPATEEGDGEFGSSTYDHVPGLNGRILSSNGDDELAESFCKDIGIPDQSVLIMRNDGVGSDPNAAGFIRRHTFPEIADYIESHL
jgi:hypothetical protein